MDKAAVIQSILPNLAHSCACEYGYAFAPTNLALVKYWGKRDQELNLPYNSSLSISLVDKGAFTYIQCHDKLDRYIVNGKTLSQDSLLFQRLHNFLNLFRPTPDTYYRVETDLNIPLAAGFASSACGFAALVKALNHLYNWQLAPRELSILARLGSGSACRSLWPGFVEWQCGREADGMDSHGVPLDYSWSELRLGLLIVSAKAKAISSRDAMQHTVLTSPLYRDWPEQAEQAVQNIKVALRQRDFIALGEIAEANALLMHKTMLAANPAIDYSPKELLKAQAKVKELRQAGVNVFFTQDAGPNLILLFLASDTETVREFFSQVKIVAPFPKEMAEQVILVNEADEALGAQEKLAAHKSGQLHRAFSIFVFRHGERGSELLLQRRQYGKYHSAGLWSNTCCGHPRPHEEVISGATRRLQEEMGFTTNLYNVGKVCYKLPLANKLIEHELDHILVGVEDIAKPEFNLNEVKACRWLGIDQLKRDLTEHPQHYSAWFKTALDIAVHELHRL